MPPSTPPKTKLDRLRDVIDEFDSPAQAFQLAQEMHDQKIRARHAERIKGHRGALSVGDWAALEAYMGALPSEAEPPLAPLMYQLQAELKVAIQQRNTAEVLTLLMAIAKATKPYNLYEQGQ